MHFGFALHRRLSSAAAAVCLTFITAACGLVQEEPSPLVPGSQWRVVALDGQRAAGGELLLTFIGQTATLSSQCGAAVSTVTTADSGRALEFGPFDGPAAGAPCPAQVLDLHQRAASALEGTEAWERVGSAVELQGGGGVIRLEPQRTDT